MRPGGDVNDDLNRAQPDLDAQPDLEVLRAVEQRVLWLATRIIDHANRRPTATGPT